MKRQFNTETEALEWIADIDKLMGFPDSSGTLTYAVPTLNEDGLWEFEEGNDIPVKDESDTTG